VQPLPIAHNHAVARRHAIVSSRYPMDKKPHTARDAIKWRHGARRVAAREALATEEPLEIRLGGRRFTITMRTPGHDEELVAGFLFAEGFTDSAAELGEIRRVRTRAGTAEPNIVDVILSVPAAALRERLKRNFAMTSSCGLCGKTSIDAIRRRVAPLAGGARVASARLPAMAAHMHEAQKIFAATGGLHAAALFASDGKLRALREDIGRHNAVDKLVGWALGRAMVPLGGAVMLVSGRASFEIVQKAAAAGIPVLAAVSAPSSLAVELADELGMTLVGFVRDGGFNIYTHPERIA
jgi:FdhD protein